MIKRFKNLFGRWGQNRVDDLAGCRTLVQGEREYIRRLARQHAYPDTPDGEPFTVTIPSDTFDKPRAYKNVRLILCSLNQQSDESLTVANCVFDEGGEIPIHRHVNKEHICVLAGSLTETVSGKVFRADESLTVHADQLHGFKSDYALLTVTWRPELEIIESAVEEQACA